MRQWNPCFTPRWGGSVLRNLPAPLTHLPYLPGLLGFPCSPSQDCGCCWAVMPFCSLGSIVFMECCVFYCICINHLLLAHPSHASPLHNFASFLSLLYFTLLLLRSFSMNLLVHIILARTYIPWTCTLWNEVCWCYWFTKDWHAWL